MPHSTVWHFDPICKACQQKERNEKKNEDRPLAIVKGRAAVAAHKAGTSTEFFMAQMNYGSLVEPFRSLMGPNGKCQNCGHAFLNERDIQLDHILPPRHKQDWPRLHARNVVVLCGSCNKAKGAKAFDVWLEDQDTSRLSHLESKPLSRQISLFD